MWACGVEWDGVVLGEVWVGGGVVGLVGWGGGGWGAGGARAAAFFARRAPDHFPPSLKPAVSPLSPQETVCAFPYHVKRVLVHTPRVALELDRPVDRLPVGGVQFRHVGNGRPLINGEGGRPVEEPDETAFLFNGESVRDGLLRPVALALGSRHIQDPPIRREAPPVVGARDGGLGGAIVILDFGHPPFGQGGAAVHTRVGQRVHFPRVPIPEQHQVFTQDSDAHRVGADFFRHADAVPEVFEIGFAPL